MSVTEDRAGQHFVPDTGNQRQLRDAFGCFATGVTVVAAPTANGPIGVTANSFTSVSLDPPLVLWCLGKSSDRFAAFAEADRYAIHVLHEDQEAVSDGFAQSPRFFDDVRWTESEDNVPLIDGCLARFDCTHHARHDAGDHVILVGRVRSVMMKPGRPLLFATGGYCALDGG